jgi:hypothetical protein
MKTVGLFQPGASKLFETYRGASTAHRGDLNVMLDEPNTDDEEPTVIAEIALRSGQRVREVK